MFDLKFEWSSSGFERSLNDSCQIFKRELALVLVLYSISYDVGAVFFIVIYVDRAYPIILFTDKTERASQLAV